MGELDLKEGLHDIATHAAAWSRILNRASALVRTREEAFDLKAASVELQKRAEAVVAAFEGGAEESEILQQADRFLALAPRITRSIKAMTGHLHGLGRAEPGDIGWLEHEQAALNGLLVRRERIRDRTPDQDPCPQF